MRLVVKRFIEQHITWIQNESWEQVFSDWYEETKYFYPDTGEFEEFLDAMTVAKVSVDLDARRPIIIRIAQRDIDYIMNHQDEWNGRKQYVPFRYLADELDSDLGYSEEELADIFIEAGDSMGCTYDGKHGLTWEE